MEKIKKILLIFSLMLFINVRNVYADEITCNYNFGYNWLDTFTTPPTNFFTTDDNCVASVSPTITDLTSSYKLRATTGKIYDFNINLYNNPSYDKWNNKTGYVILKHKDMDFYALGVSDSVSSRNITSSVCTNTNSFIYFSKDKEILSKMWQKQDYHLTLSNGDIIYYKMRTASNHEEDYIDCDMSHYYLASTNIEKVSFNGEDQDIYVPPEPTPTPPKINLNKFYVPNYEKGNCVEILDKDTIRVFENENVNNYTDYFINSNYISKTGQVDSDYVKSCSTLEFSNIRYYGNDFPQILFIVFCITLFTIGFPYILYKRFRKR